MGQTPNYVLKSQITDYYVPGSVLALYILIIFTTLILLLFKRLCCKVNRVRYHGVGGPEQPADMATKDKQESVEKDLKEVEMAQKGLSNQDNKKEINIMQYSSTSMLQIDDDFTVVHAEQLGEREAR